MRTLASLLFLIALSYGTHAAHFAVDLGSEYLKVSVIKPGRVPISVVVNEMSKRKSRAAVSIVNGERYLADEAFGMRTRRPETVFFRLRDFLGRPANDSGVEKALAMGSDKWPLKVVEDEDRGTVRFALDDKETISAEELVASILYYAKAITDAEAGENVVECVITVPAFFGPAQKQAIMDAARLIGLEVLAVIHSHAAAALQYGIERDFSGNSEDIILYDMGSSATQVALISYSSYETKEKGKKKTVNQFQVKDATWDENLGGDDLDWILVEYFAEEFKEKYKMDLREAPKAVAKLKLAVRKTKEVLSANAQSPIYVEGLYKDVDFSSSISREKFETLAAGFFDRAQKPLQQILERNYIDVAALSNVEMIGGGTRVPKIKAALAETLGGRELDRHLDADEAVVMGAGLVAANLSTTFRLRQFGMIDGAFYPISLKVDEPKDWMSPVGAAEAANLFKPKALLPFMKKVPGKRVVHLPDFTADPFTFKLFFNASAPFGLPPGTDVEEYASYEVSGAKEAADKYGEGGKVSLTFIADAGGVISLEKAEYINEIEVKPKEKAEKGEEKGENEEESTSEQASKDASADTENESGSESDEEEGEQKEEGDSEENDDGTAKKEEMEAEKEGEDKSEDEPAAASAKKEKKPRKKTVRHALKVFGPSLVMKGLGKDDWFLNSKKVLRNFVKREKEKKETEKAKNDLESYIYSTTEKLDSNEDFQKVTTEEQRSTFKKELANMEEWLYMEGEDQPAREFKKKLSDLKKTGDKIQTRVDEAASRVSTLATSRAFVELIKKAANTWPEAKPWLNQTEVQNLLTKTDEFEAYLDDIEKKQEALAPHEDPAFLGQDVITKLMTLDRPFKRLNTKRGPKPPPAPKNKTENLETESSGDKKEAEALGKEEASQDEETKTNEKDEL